MLLVAVHPVIACCPHKGQPSHPDSNAHFTITEQISTKHRHNARSEEVDVGTGHPVGDSLDTLDMCDDIGWW